MCRSAAVCLCACLALSQILVADEPASPGPEATRKTADEEWARGLWLSFPWSRASETEVTAQFTRALVQSESKAPIYVSMGDVASGLAYRQLVEDVFTSAQEEFEGELASQLEQNLPSVDLEDEKQVKAALKASLEESYGALSGSDATLDAIEKLASASGEASDPAMAYYLAAVAEDPDYLPAWFRLAKYSEGDAFDEAMQRFQKADPDNALPHYMFAAELLRRNDPDAALKAVNAGNAEPTCRWYPAEVPEAFDLRYPENDLWEEHEVAGEPITTASLLFWRKRFESLSAHEHRLHHSLRPIQDELIERAKELHGEGRHNEAVEILESVREMGHRLMTIEPRDGLIIVTGLDAASRPYRTLKAAYSELEADAKIAALDASQGRLKAFRSGFIAAIGEAKPQKEDLKRILLGEKNVVEEERVRLRQALVDAGIIDEDDASN